ncbi:MAG: hypothetical protein ACREVD_03465, partial [Burkholderiales bacterium]
EEPALIGPLPGAVARPDRPRWFVPSALAASVAAVAFVGWMAFAPQQQAGPVLVPVAQAPQPGAAAAATVRAANEAPARLPITAATRDYLIAHQAFSPRNSLQGMAPYVRSVSAESTPVKP